MSRALAVAGLTLLVCSVPIALPLCAPHVPAGAAFGLSALWGYGCAHSIGTVLRWRERRHGGR